MKRPLAAPQYDATMLFGDAHITKMVFLAASLTVYTAGAPVIPDSDPFSGGAQRLPSELQTTGTKRSEEAYVTVLYGEFLLGVRVLGQSLKESQTERDRIVLCAPDVPDSAKEVLAKDGWVVRSVQHTQSRIKFFTKLQVWTLTEYRKLIFIDADAIVIANIDQLFRCGNFCAVFRHSDLFNSGVFVITPSQAVYNDMLNIVKEGRFHADQTLLNYYFRQLKYASLFDPDTPSPHAELMRLPAGYNSDVGIYYINSGWTFPAQTVKVLHYTLGPVKPWKWWTYPLFELNWKWEYLRQQLTPINTQYSTSTYVSCTFLLVTLIALYFKLHCWPSGQFNSQACQRLWAAYLYFINTHILVDGKTAKCYPSAALLLSYYFAYKLVPTILYPWEAHFVFVVWTSFFVLFFFGFYCHLGYIQGCQKSSTKKATIKSFLCLLAFMLFFFLQLYILYRTPKFSDRVKCFVALFTLGFVLVHVVARHLIRMWSSIHSNS